MNAFPLMKICTETMKGGLLIIARAESSKYVK